jgi:hypothetical protein
MLGILGIMGRWGGRYEREMQTINNNNPSLALQRLDVCVYDLTGSPASISTAFYFVLRVKERRA